MRRIGSMKPRVILAAAAAVVTATISTGTAIASMSDEKGSAVVLTAGWGDGGLSPLGLIIGVIVTILVLKLIFRLIAGPRWYGGPWSWGHPHGGWHARYPQDAPEAFRRWHDRAHAGVGHDGQRDDGDQTSGAAPVDRPDAGLTGSITPPAAPQVGPDAIQVPYGHYPGQSPYGPYPGTPPYGPYPGQAPYGPYPGQSPYGQYPGSTPWPYAAPPQAAPPGQAPQAPYPTQSPHGQVPGEPPTGQRRP